MKVKIKYDVYGKYRSPKQAKAHCRSGWNIGNMEAVITITRKSRWGYDGDGLDKCFTLSGFPSDEIDIKIIEKIKDVIKNIHHPPAEDCWVCKYCRKIGLVFCRQCRKKLILNKLPLPLP